MIEDPKVGDYVRVESTNFQYYATIIRIHPDDRRLWIVTPDFNRNPLRFNEPLEPRHCILHDGIPTRQISVESSGCTLIRRGLKQELHRLWKPLL